MLPYLAWNRVFQYSNSTFVVLCVSIWIITAFVSSLMILMRPAWPDVASSSSTRIFLSPICFLIQHFSSYGAASTTLARRAHVSSEEKSLDSYRLSYLMVLMLLDCTNKENSCAVGALPNFALYKCNISRQVYSWIKSSRYCCVSLWPNQHGQSKNLSSVNWVMPDWTTALMRRMSS